MIMNTQEGSKGSKEQEYLSKKVLVNGQFVTLYSINGQTWLSSPEEIPELMARLENARIMLSNPEKAEAEAQQPKPAPTEAQPPKVIQNKYRMKGPKPRPILKQGGVVIKGTPIEPISASHTVVSFSHDQQMAEEQSNASGRPRTATGKSKTSGKAKAPKHIAPVLSLVSKSKKQETSAQGELKKSTAKLGTNKSHEVVKAKEKQAARKKASAKKVSVKKGANTRIAVDTKRVPAKKDKKSAAMKNVSKAASKAAPKASGHKGKPTSSKKKSSR